MPGNPYFEKVTERVIFRDSTLGLREDVLRTATGFINRKVVEYRKSSAVLPVGIDGRVLLIRHYRHPIRRELWEIPGGVIEPAESPEDAAARELREETGYVAGGMELLTRFCPEPAFSDHEIILFRGSPLEPCPAGPSSEEEIVEARFFSITEVQTLLESGESASSWTVIALTIEMNSRISGLSTGA